MIFYEVFDESDPAASDAWFPTKKHATDHIRATYGWPKPDGVSLIMHEIQGGLTKQRVCSMLTNLPQR